MFLVDVGDESPHLFGRLGMLDLLEVIIRKRESDYTLGLAVAFAPRLEIGL